MFTRVDIARPFRTYARSRQWRQEPQSKRTVDTVRGLTHVAHSIVPDESRRRSG